MKAERPLSRYLDSPTDEARLSRMWSAIRGGRARPARRPWALAVVPLAAAAAWLVWVLWPAAPAEPAMRATWAPPARFEGRDAEGASFELGDGSRINVDTQTTLTTIESDDERFVTLLERGRATFDVRPGGPRRWVVEGGLATIEVVGTLFEVERGEDTVRVHVRRGVVLVRGERVPDRVARLAAGESITVSAAPPVGAPAPSASATEPPEVAANDGPSASRAQRTPAPDRHRAQGDVGDLMQRASASRRAGDAHHAAVLLQQASAQEDDPRAALASFTLGRLEMDELNRPARARRALERALRLGLPQRLEQQAQRRLQQLGR